MSMTGTVTQWLVRLKAGEDDALARLHGRYWPVLVGMARKQLRGVSRRVEDEEDAAQKAFWSFYQSFKSGRIPRLENRSDLLSLLVIITARKVASQVEQQNRQKRGGGEVRGESALNILAETSTNPGGFEGKAGPWLSGDEVASLNENYQRCLNCLPDNLRSYAELYLAGFTYDEIADSLQCSERSVARKVPLILRKWQALLAEEATS